MTKDKQREALEAINALDTALYSLSLAEKKFFGERFKIIRDYITSTDSRAGECNVDNEPINEKLKAIMDAPTPFTPAPDEVVIKRVDLENSIYAIGKAFAFLVPESVPAVYSREAHKILENALEKK